MPLAPASRLGPYEILAPLGAGGMGEVYKARDTRLDRIVAIKVLHSHLADRPELRQRFEREAKAISSLSHPNICTLFDVGHESGVDYLVMEYLEGEALSDRLARGPLPTEEMVRHGIEIAGALDRAHRQGIVHRDLKPGNVILTRTGAKVLDFGLAKVAAGTAAGSAVDALTSLPTLAAGTSPLTTEGTLLGTFQYMAPEQLEGAEADARTDVFALGSLLYEMATGRPAFQGKSRASLISAIMSGEPPPLMSLQPLAPPALDHVIRTCLAKDPENRIQTAHDVGLQLQWIAEGGSQAGVPAPVAARRKDRERLAWGIAAVTGIAAAALAILVVRGGRQSAETIRLQVSVPTSLAQMGSPRISPDGRFIAFDGADSTGRRMIWLRPLGSLTADPIPATDNVTARPFWSPDSRHIGFVAGGKLKKVSVAGGPAQTICDAPSGWDGAWSRDGSILFDGGGGDPIRRVPSSGGVAATAVPIDTGTVGWPEFLPDGRHFCYLRRRSGGVDEICIGDLRTGRRRMIGTAESRIEYSPAGYLLFVRDRTLVAQAFDAGSLRLTGEPVPIVDGIGTGANGLAHFSVSDNGVLVYSASGGGFTQLTWTDRTGKHLAQVGVAGNIGTPALAPDEKRVAVRLLDPEGTNRDIWVFDLERGTNTRLTFDPGTDTSPVWSPDGSRIAFSSERTPNSFTLFQKLSNGAGGEETLLTSAIPTFPTSWSRDGRYLAYVQNSPTGPDIGVLPLFGDRKPIPFLGTPAIETHARFSPDGKWIAYTSDESGRFEVYVQAFPGPGGKWQISTRGGLQPMWRGDGRELYYLTMDGRMMAVSIKTDAGFVAGVPVPLFDARVPIGPATALYAVSADGRRFLLNVPVNSDQIAPLTVVLNWNAELQKR